MFEGYWRDKPGAEEAVRKSIDVFLETLKEKIKQTINKNNKPRQEVFKFYKDPRWMAVPTMFGKVYPSYKRTPLQPFPRKSKEERKVRLG